MHALNGWLVFSEVPNEKDQIVCSFIFNSNNCIRLFPAISTSCICDAEQVQRKIFANNLLFRFLLRFSNKRILPLFNYSHLNNSKKKNFRQSRIFIKLNVLYFLFIRTFIISSFLWRTICYNLITSFNKLSSMLFTDLFITNKFKFYMWCFYINININESINNCFSVWFCRTDLLWKTKIFLNCCQMSKL